MARFRRYRVFLLVAAIAVVALLKFRTSGAAWSEASLRAVGAPGFRSEADTVQNLRLHVPAATRPPVLQTPPPLKQVPPPSSSPSPSPSPPGDEKPSVPLQNQPQRYGKPINGVILDDASGSSSTDIPPVHWSKQPEQFPVPAESLIRLPTGKPQPIPKIQFEFKPESATAKADRLAKLAIIKGVAKKAWDGYKKFAWLHDELRPKSGTFKDPFAHWGATLVDSLDTLWIMGLKEDFEEAVKAVDLIDFTTTTRADIPMLETTFRYLGGLVAAYDISGKTYKSLLDKAVELAEILIGAFDTPNRMPQLFYYWRPQYTSQTHRADMRAVLAEVGSLSMEFTRLAQLTGEEKYYDAIARITDNLEEFQMNSSLPGMWPTDLNISGCSKLSTDPVPPAPLGPNDHARVAKESASPDGKNYVPLDLPEPVVLANDDVPTKADSGLNRAAKGRIQNREGKPLEDDKRYIPLNLPEPVFLTSDDAPAADMAKEKAASHDVSVSGTEASKRTEKRRVTRLGTDLLEKRQLDVDLSLPPTAALDAEHVLASSAAAVESSPPECTQGFEAAIGYGPHKYTLGGASDSTYEYLPKQYLLLGGQVEKYRTMYEASADVFKKYLIYRPMLPDEEDILFSGTMAVPSDDKAKDEAEVGELTSENAHLTCFAGGMLGLGAKLFERPDDLEIAKKLTEGCIWGYNMTASGIMPEAFEVITCKDVKHCPWNQTAYWEKLDPYPEQRKDSYELALEAYSSNLAASVQNQAELASMTAIPTPSHASAIDADTLDRRQLLDLVDDAENAHMPSAPPGPRQDRNSVMGGESEEGEGPPTKVQPTLDFPEAASQPDVTLPQFPVLPSPDPPLSQEDYAMARLQNERLPPGVTSIMSRYYILRPEAIESVWYMYRITGSPHWREAGWRMFQAINKHTSTEYGNSAIDDCTEPHPVIKDEMKSFWLAETLKYFYLLFEEENVVSLDEWVLNTAAHPFRRPK